MQFIWEIGTFILVRKELGILPLMATAAPVGSLLLFGQSSVLAPFIPTVF